MTAPHQGLAMTHTSPEGEAGERPIGGAAPLAPEPDYETLADVWPDSDAEQALDAAQNAYETTHLGWTP
jgi:hypothetical protein